MSIVSWFFKKEEPDENFSLYQQREFMRVRLEHEREMREIEHENRVRELEMEREFRRIDAESDRAFRNQLQQERIERNDARIYQPFRGFNS